MSQKYTLYYTDTGRIHCTSQCPDGMLPPEGPMPDGSGLSVIHGRVDPNIGMVVDSIPTRISDEELIEMDRKDMWFKARQKRHQKLVETDFKMTGDYPLTAAEKRKLKRQRQQSRDITKATKDPREALRLLDEIWNTET